ncbi:MAG: asparagine synthase (glutamine-hydrolyzing) [Alphaproteobacteria bacterium]|jgi:asparagine synthase (glutamine-hydrolysing)|nr:asparagine synthase (glutamine-hydrolyzing) [Alphaproteobacteria bacterium]MDP6589305.1 asparagine synthase (glutamine-hydrolyzing) [Alphaproteobacteria bacterium]MDP6817246.1 asparagine synthase (glutamine-hydrolyzing) [Alphaproteobacteria bacterium]
MCGFAGQTDFGGIDRAALAPRLAAALERLRPRGPDSQDSWFDARCALANTRLAVQDLSSAASLPMQAHGLVIAYNGEIYNFRELRDELTAAGHAIASSGDSEVLLAGWQHWGEGLLPRLAGMFALALWDAEKSELILVRDRLGKKPLLYKAESGRCTFASELAALETLLESRPALDQQALRMLFTLRYVPEPLSIAEGVRKLPAGHLARVTAAGVEERRWYDPLAGRPPIYSDPAEAEQDLVRHFDGAVRRRLIADVPLGVFLSGGIDSALVAASMTRAGERVRSFTVGFADAAEYYEERPAAERVARHLGTEHMAIEISPQDARAAIDAVFLGLDEPFADSSAVPAYLLARETRRHVTVALSGDGADEVFGGYRKYQGELMAARYRALPALLRSGLIEPLAAALPERKSSPLLERTRRLRRFTRHAGKDAVGRQAGWMRLMDEGELERLFVASERAPDLEHMVAELRREAGDDDPLNAMLHADTRLGLAGDMLVKSDRMSMANSLEVRCPFLDHRVVECAEAMPGAFKLAPGEGKRVLRRAFAGRLPKEVFELPKKGFEIPIAEWLTGPLDELTRRSIDADRLRRQGIFRAEQPRRWYADLKAGRRDSSEKLWTLIAFQAWCENFRPDLAA